MHANGREDPLDPSGREGLHFHSLSGGSVGAAEDGQIGACVPKTAVRLGLPIGGPAGPCRYRLLVVYISSGANWEKASGAASSKRVSRLRNTKRTLSVGPLRCLATWISA
jgi:hypothetical protein